MELIMRIKPSVIVLRKLASQSKRNRRDVDSIARVLGDEAKSRSTSVAYVPDATLKAFFRGLGKRNKYDVASLLAIWFSDLAWKLPPARKLYKPEPWTMAIFDAVAIGTVYLRTQGLLNIGGKEP